MAYTLDVKTYQNYINGEWVAPENETVFSSVNPADFNKIVGFVPLSEKKDVDFAVESAKNASVIWRNMSGSERGDLLRTTADILENRADEIAESITNEMGKTFIEAKGETLRAVYALRYYSTEGVRAIGEVIPSNEKDAFLFTTRVPLGVVGLITPWNFPVMIPVWKMAPALAYGNTVVIKPAIETTVSAIKVLECFIEAGFPPGVINLISGRGSTIGNALCDHPDVKAISFTGSNDVGKVIAAKAVQRGAKFQLEMGGKNPAIVTTHANLDLAAELIVNGSMKSSGQKCTATSRAIVLSEVFDDFKEIVIQKLKQIKVGNGFAPDSYMGPVASKNQFDNVLNSIKQGIEEGATLTLGGNSIKDGDMENGYFIEPTLFEDVKPHMSIAQEETFGPVLAMIKAHSIEEAIQIANDIKYGLSATIFTEQMNEAFRFINEIEAGMVKINGESSGVEIHAPFGGVKASSSQNRELGRAALEFFTSMKTVTMKP